MSPFLPGLDERLYALQDANFNVTTITDINGAAVERYRYTPYGERTVLDASFVLKSAGSGFDWEVGHQGMFLDGETGLVYNRNRMLHPGLGRFMQRDPLGYVDGMSLYQYVGSSPINWVDPFGLQFAGEPGGLGDLDPFGQPKALPCLGEPGDPLLASELALAALERALLEAELAAERALSAGLDLLSGLPKGMGTPIPPTPPIGAWPGSPATSLGAIVTPVAGLAGIANGPIKNNINALERGIDRNSALIDDILKID